MSVNQPVSPAADRATIPEKRFKAKIRARMRDRGGREVIRRRRRKGRKRLTP